MAWYPDWAVALDAVAKDEPDAKLSKRNAEDVIRELQRLQGEVQDLRSRTRGVQIGHGNTQSNTF